MGHVIREQQLLLRRNDIQRGGRGAEIEPALIDVEEAEDAVFVGNDLRLGGRRRNLGSGWKSRSRLAPLDLGGGCRLREIDGGKVDGIQVDRSCSRFSRTSIVFLAASVSLSRKFLLFLGSVTKKNFCFTIGGAARHKKGKTTITKKKKCIFVTMLFAPRLQEHDRSSLDVEHIQFQNFFL